MTSQLLSQTGRLPRPVGHVGVVRVRTATRVISTWGFGDPFAMALGLEGGAGAAP